MVSESEIKYGIFKTEIKNRFLCMVEVEGTDTVCYIPSSCRLSNFINLTNRSVMLKPIKKREARTKFAVYAVKYRQGYVLLNLSLSNYIIKESINRRMFAFLGSRKNIHREAIIDGYKSDLYVEDTKTVIEIKSILSFNTEAVFPTVFSERANRQLEDIKMLLDRGYKVCYMFVSMYPGVKKLFINEQQEEYCRLFRKCVDKGMMVNAVSLYMKDAVPTVKSRVHLVPS